MTVFKRVRPAHYELVQTQLSRPAINARMAWYFRVVAQNGRVLCHSETYNSKAAALRAIAAVRAASNMVVEK